MKVCMMRRVRLRYERDSTLKRIILSKSDTWPQVKAKIAGAFDRLPFESGRIIISDAELEIGPSIPIFGHYLNQFHAGGRTIINPLRMRSRVTVVVLCVCLSVTTLVARGLISTVVPTESARYFLKVFNSWISLKTLCSKVMALFTLRSARPYMKYCSYSTRIRVMTRKL